MDCSRSGPVRSTRPVAYAFLAAVASLALMAVYVGASSATIQSDSLDSLDSVDSVDGSPVVTPATVTAVNATGELVEVAILGSDYSLTSSEVTVTEAGAAVESSTVSTATGQARTSEIMFVVDLDNRIVADGNLNSIVTSVIASTDQLPASTVGLVGAGAEAELLARLSSDRTRLERGLQSMRAGRGAALYDGVRLAAASFEGEARGPRSIIVISSGSDSASNAALKAVESQLVRSGAQVIWVPLAGDDAGLTQMVDTSGGATVTPSALTPAIASAVAVAADRLLVSFPSTVDAGVRSDVVVDLAGEAVAFSYPAGVNTVTALQLQAREVAEPNAPGFFGQPVVLYVSLALTFIAISTALWALASMFAGGETSLDKLLARYSERDETMDDEEIQEMLVQTALVRRAIDMTEGFAERQGFLIRVEELLERANIPIRAGEALFFLTAIVVVTSGLVLSATGSLIATALFALIAGLGGFAAVQFMAGRRLKQFESQLPDALQLLAGTLRAGYSLPQGLDAVSTEIADPMGQELRRAITETQLGRELEEALSGVAERLDSEDFAWAVMAVGIQREVGGNLSEVLMTVSETMIQRERLNREVSALTAEGRVSAGILSMLPPGLGVVMWVMNPDYLGILFSRTIGLVLLGLAVVSGLIGLAWMKKVVTIDV